MVREGLIKLAKERLDLARRIYYRIKEHYSEDLEDERFLRYFVLVSDEENVKSILNERRQTVANLRVQAKAMGIPNWWNLTKIELQREISERDKKKEELAKRKGQAGNSE